MNLKHLSLLSLAVPALAVAKSDKPNIIFLLADDIGVREIPAYGSTEWYDYQNGCMVSDPKLQAQTGIPNFTRIKS